MANVRSGTSDYVAVQNLFLEDIKIRWVLQSCSILSRTNAWFTAKGTDLSMMNDLHSVGAPKSNTEEDAINTASI